MESPNDIREDASPERGVPSDNTQTAKHEVRREIVEFVKLVAWFLVLFVALRTLVIESCDIQGQSMYPTLSSNERILVFKLPHLLSRHWPFGTWDAIHPGDIIVFDSPDSKSTRYVKRVIAKGPDVESASSVRATGDTSVPDGVRVSVADGAVYVNNQKLNEKYLPPDTETDTSERTYDVTLEPGDYFVMGDNRRDSRDSRSFGPIQDDSIIGKVVLRFWPLGKFGAL